MKQRESISNTLVTRLEDVTSKRRFFIKILIVHTTALLNKDTWTAFFRCNRTETSATGKSCPITKIILHKFLNMQ